MLVKKKQPYSSSKPTTDYTNDVPPYLSIDIVYFSCLYKQRNGQSIRNKIWKDTLFLRAEEEDEIKT